MSCLCFYVFGTSDGNQQDATTVCLRAFKYAAKDKNEKKQKA